MGVIPTDADAIIGARTNPWEEPTIPNVCDYPNAVRDFGAVGWEIVTSAAP